MSPRPPTPKPTRRQIEALTFITRFQERFGYPPSLREIGSSLSIGSTNGVRSLLLTLERDGFITRRRRISRGIEVTAKGATVLPIPRDHPAQARAKVNLVPVLGRVRAGEPELAWEERESFLRVDSDLFPYPDVFALKVKGDSMKEAGILPGDWVLARPQLSLSPGDIVVAVIEEEATVKRYFPMKSRIRLEPANPNYPSLTIDPAKTQFTIAGKVVGVLRKL